MAQPSIGIVIAAIVLFLWFVGDIDRGTVIGLALGWLAGAVMMRFELRVQGELEAAKLARDEYERAKRRGVEL